MSESREPKRSRGASPKGVARRQAILDRAIEVFAARGSDRTSLRSIAEAVGVTHSALTHYFGSLEELLVEVYRESERHDASPQPSAHTPVQAMQNSARQNRTVPGHVQLYTTLVALALEEGHHAAREFATDRFAAVRGRVAEQVRAQQDAGRIRTDVDPELVAALIVAASDGLQTQWLLEPSLDENATLDVLELLLAPPAP